MLECEKNSLQKLISVNKTSLGGELQFSMVKLAAGPLMADSEAFLQHCLDRDLALATVETYRQVLSTFVAWMASNYPDVHSVTQISLSHLQHFRRHLRLSSAANGHEASPRTMAKYLATIRSLLKFYAVQQGAPVLVRDHVKLPAPAAKPTLRPLNNSELEKLLSAPPADRLWGLRDRAIIALLGRAGLRLNELCALNRRDIREELLTREPTMRLVVSAGPRESREVILDAETQRHLLDYLSRRCDHYPPLFIRHKPGKGADRDDPLHRLTRQMVNRMLVKYARQACLSSLPSAPSLRLAAVAAAAG